MIRLLVTGADSESPSNGTSFEQTFASFAEAREKAYSFVSEWLKDGYSQTPARIYTKGSLWWRVALIDEYYVQWLPV